MKKIAALAVMAMASGAAFGGSTAAGPVGTNAVGSTVTPATVFSPALSDAMKDAGENYLQGSTGVTYLTPEQTESIWSLMERDSAAVVTGSVIKAPTTFQDGTTGWVTLDRSTNSILMTQVE